jgi:hypothetical protein
MNISEFVPAIKAITENWDLKQNHEIINRNVTRLKEEKTMETLEACWKECNPFIDDSYYPSYWGVSKQELGEKITMKSFKNNEIEQICDKKIKFLSECETDIMNKFHYKVLCQNLAILIFQTVNLINIADELEKAKQTVANKSLFNNLNEIIQQIKMKIQEIEDNFLLKNSFELEDLKYDLEELKIKALIELSQLDKSLMNANEKLIKVKEMSSANFFQNLINTSASILTLYSNYNILNQANRLFGFFQTTFFGIFTLKSIDNYYTADKQLDQLKQMQTELNVLKIKVDEMSQLIRDIRKSIRERSLSKKQ